MGNSIYHSSVIYNRLIPLNLGQIFSSTVMKHILSVLISVFLRGYRGKTVDFACASPCHRTTIAHFLNRGKWDDEKLERILKEAVVRTIYEESLRSGKPVFCIVDDTISSKTKPSLQALHPIEDAYFHQSHLKGRQDYGHQAVSVMLSCNGLVLNYATIMYDKSKSKIKIVQEIGDMIYPCFSSEHEEICLVIAGDGNGYKIFHSIIQQVMDDMITDYEEIAKKAGVKLRFTEEIQ